MHCCFLLKTQGLSKKKVTLQDIASQLHISIATVSRALQNNSRISDSVRAKVLTVAKDLGYFETKFPAAAVTAKMPLIGVIVPKLSYHLYAMAISGIEKVAEANNMHIVICQSDESYEREKNIINEFVKMGVSGLIVSLAGTTKEFSHLHQLKSNGIPLVLFNRQCDEVAADKVVIDNFKAGYDTAEHLISTGCKSVAFLGGPEMLQISNTRLQGYRQALKDANIPANQKLVAFCGLTKESNISTARKLLYGPNPPDGIVAFSDQIAIAAMVAAKERGLHIPQDVAIIGFNNEPVDELMEPSLSSVDQPAFQMGHAAAELIFEQIQNPSKENTLLVLHSELVIRSSTNRNKR